MGQPFNVIQYWLIHKLIAREVGIEPGDLVFSIAIPHIYDRHVGTIKEQLERFEKINQIDPVEDKIVTVELDDVPFQEFSYQNMHITDYDTWHDEPLKRYSFEKAI